MATGQCRATAECRPRNSGDRWFCTRSSLAGGPCTEGPLTDGKCCNTIPTCQPVRSWMAKRVLITKWFVFLVLGCLLLLIAGKHKEEFIDPGPLTSQHAKLTDCKQCHKVAALTPMNWWHEAFSNSIAQDDETLCLGCHNLGENSIQPHSLSSEILISLKNSSQILEDSPKTIGLLLHNAVLTSDDTSTAALSCANCHNEHNGPNFDLTWIPDESCNICHTAQFKSFSEGHPAFTKYPYERRTRIQFDHLSHLGKHFKDQKNILYTPSNCQSCHEVGSTGQTMTVKPFTLSCGECHQNQIKGIEGRGGPKGIAVINVPGLDLYTLREQGISVGEWPEYAEESLTPFMDLLLSPDSNYAESKVLLQNVDLLDLSSATQDQMKAVSKFVWSVKRLFFDLKINGVNEIKSRLEKATDRQLQGNELAQLTGSLSSGVVHNAQSVWFPNLLVEITRYQRGEKIFETISTENLNSDLGAIDINSRAAKSLNEDDEIDLIDDDEIDLTDDDEIDLTEDNITSIAESESITREIATPVNDEEWAAAGGWYQDDDYFALRYRPVGHSDLFIESWLEFLVPLLTASIEDEVSVIRLDTNIGSLFRNIASPRSPGTCTKCHSIDINNQSRVEINWYGVRANLHGKKFTKFSHETHFSLLDERGCVTCHQLNIDSEYTSSFEDHNPTIFESNFVTIDQSTCTNCHQPAKASDDCLTCHNYHIGVFPGKLVVTGFPETN